MESFVIFTIGIFVNLAFLWIGVAEASTDFIASYKLTKTGKVVDQKPVWAFSQGNLSNPSIDLDKGIRSKIEDGLNVDEINAHQETPCWSLLMSLNNENKSCMETGDSDPY